MKWIRCTINTTTEAEDLISCALADLGIEGVEIENRVPLTEADTAKMFIDILPDLGEDDGTSRVSFYLDAGEDHTEILANVREALEEIRAFADVGPGDISESVTEDRDWMNNWKEFFHPFTIADPRPGMHRDILIRPTWETSGGTDKDKILIEIDPGISFGTGQHETTQLCIRQLMNYVKDGDKVLDIGCGSGILSIAALKLGAGYVAGTDVDGQCLTSTKENLKRNHLDGAPVDLYLGNLIDDAALRETIGTERFDVVAANILADVIIPMAPVIRPLLKEGGVFIASGIIDFKEDEVREAIEAAGLTVLTVTEQGEWVSITARR